MSPVAQSDGHDAPGLVDEPAPGIAATGDNVVVGLEDAVRPAVVAHELPAEMAFRRCPPGPPPARISVIIQPSPALDNTPATPALGAACGPGESRGSAAAARWWPDPPSPCAHSPQPGNTSLPRCLRTSEDPAIRADRDWVAHRAPGAAAPRSRRRAGWTRRRSPAPRFLRHGAHEIHHQPRPVPTPQSNADGDGIGGEAIAFPALPPPSLRLRAGQSARSTAARVIGRTALR